MAMLFMSWANFRDQMEEFNRKNPDKQDTAYISVVVVYKSSNWKTPYDERARSYRVWNCNRAFQDGKISNSIFGDCLDGSDVGVRLDWYNWDIDYCYFE